ncbi:MAG: alanine--tRNA ligase [Bdellovibrionales bacterium]|nr:alanine--tRNA ligase [Bdellovibrionales bacterium]
MRRIIRRAVRHGRVLNFPEPFLKATCQRVIALMAEQYPELKEKRDLILKVVDSEERKFYETLDAGLSLLQKEVEKLPVEAKFPGETAFLLYDTYGFPLDLTEDALKGYSRVVDSAGYDRAMEQQRQRSRADRKSQGVSFESSSVPKEATQFVGYAENAIEAELLHIAYPAASSHAKPGDQVTLYFDRTPFYAESGGQVGDTGEVRLPSAKLQVLDTQKIQGRYFAHVCEVIEGEVAENARGNKAQLEIDSVRRQLIRANHSATHLLHAALRSVLGEHVKQAGSRVDEKSLRFDYSHFEPVTPEQLLEIQRFMNFEIRRNHQVITKEMDIEEAKSKGAMALFGEKYGDVVRVVEIGPHSLELCGGTHAIRSGDIGLVMLKHESGISAGVRRIECWASEGALAELLIERQDRHQIAQLLRSDPTNLSEKIERVLTHSRELEKEIVTLKAQIASSASGTLVENVRKSPSGIKVIAERVAKGDVNTLRTMADDLRNRLGSGVVALAVSQDDHAMLVVGVTADLTEQINAGNLIRQVASKFGGRGGGRADFAQAGGVSAENVDQALSLFVELIQ